MGVLLTWLRLARSSNLPTVWTNCIAAWALAGGIIDWHLIILCAAASFIYAGGCTLNDAFDADWDRKFRPERPIPSGRFSAAHVWILGFLEIVLGLAAIVAIAPWTWWSALLLGVWILAYDWVHKKTPWAVLLMGACRVQLALTAALLHGGIKTYNLLHAGALFYHVVMLTIVARLESDPNAKTGALTSRAGLFLVQPAMAGILLAAPAQELFLWPARVIYVLAAVALFVFWMLRAAKRLATAGKPAIGAFVSSALAGIALLDALFAAAAWGPAGLGLALFLPLCLLLQRKIAAT